MPIHFMLHAMSDFTKSSFGIDINELNDLTGLVKTIITLSFYIL